MVIVTKIHKLTTKHKLNIINKWIIQTYLKAIKIKIIAIAIA